MSGDDYRRSEPVQPQHDQKDENEDDFKKIDKKSQMTRSFLSQKTVDFSMGDIMKDRIYRINLFIIIFSWVASSFCFYIIGFYIKYIPGSVFSNVIVTSIADGLSSITAGIIAQYVGT